MGKPKYQFYATLFDAFQDYVDSDSIWNEYWGWSENPPHTPEEFHEKQFQSLIDKINRVPFDSEAADKGTAFNEVIDCIVLGQNSTKVNITKERNEDGKVIGVKAVYNEKEFHFPLQLVSDVAKMYKGGLPQKYVEAILPTIFGDVRVYGYIDYLMPFSVNDLKTTGRYSVGKFKGHNQHLVYPYALMKNGCDVREFNYDVVVLGKYNYEIYKETYVFNPERDIPILTARAEELILFLKENRDLITDKKIFNEL